VAERFKFMNSHSLFECLVAVSNVLLIDIIWETFNYNIIRLKETPIFNKYQIKFTLDISLIRFARIETLIVWASENVKFIFKSKIHTQKISYSLGVKIWFFKLYYCKLLP
jgi:hypothetical protein